MRALELLKGCLPWPDAYKGCSRSPSVSKKRQGVVVHAPTNGVSFDDTPASLVARLVDDDGLTEADLEEIRALVERRLHDDSNATGS